MRAAEELRVVYDPDDNPQYVYRPSPESKPVLANIDNTPPRVVSVRLTGNPGASALLEVRFADTDLSSTSVEELDVAYSRNFVITRSGGKATFETTTNIPEHHAKLAPPGDLVHIPLGMLVSDTYRLEIKDGLTDRHGNTVEGARLFYYSAFPEGPTGPHVEFPDFIERPKLESTEPFNPGDKVETHVARLYYFRDAHRVAQIINRNIKSYNRAAVTQAQRAAEDARDTASHRTGDRREKEQGVVQAAEDTRDVEARLDATRISLDRARADFARQSNQLVLVLRKLQDATDPNVKNSLTKQEGDLKLAEGKARDAVTSLSGRVAELESRVARAREAERERGGEVARAQAAEDRAAENQFRAEVAAATTDPDTYVPGNINSPDAVTRVSVSVIGEGLIQLRGPIRGINKVRTMINQIDSPVGQVKVGVFTVQVNGEHGNRMEKVAGRIEGHVDISRFLTSQSLGLLRRAIQETAAVVAAGAEAQYPGHRQLDRDRKYLYAFFGRDFIDELYEMDSEFPLQRKQDPRAAFHGHGEPVAIAVHSGSGEERHPPADPAALRLPREVRTAAGRVRLPPVEPPPAPLLRHAKGSRPERLQSLPLPESARVPRCDRRQSRHHDADAARVHSPRADFQIPNGRRAGTETARNRARADRRSGQRRRPAQRGLGGRAKRSSCSGDPRLPEDRPREGIGILTAPCRSSVTNPWSHN
jgi:hypothetical protein